MGELLCLMESVPLVISGAGRTMDSLVLERLDYRLATKEERETVPDKSTETHLALAYYDTLRTHPIGLTALKASRTGVL